MDAVDLDTCDREPIHLIGAVQPHGALIAIDEQTLVASYASTNTLDYVGAGVDEILGRHIGSLIGQANADQIKDLPLEPSNPELLKPWFIDFHARDGRKIATECLPHRNNSHIILEFMHPEAAPAAVWEEEYLRRNFISELLKSGELTDVADASARIIREVTGFDRVMIYHFAEDKHGEVIAESTDRADSFLGLHYPASDIPDPARRHFLLNVMRSIPDINGVRVPIVSQSGEIAGADASAPLDLTFSKLRAVAPVHVEYLNNMGVAASLSISLIANQKLWGLVACHHYTPRAVSSSRLRFAELMGGTTSSLLQSIENTAQLRRSSSAEKTAFFIEGEARSGKPFRQVIDMWAEELMAVADAQGMLLALGGKVETFGTVPKRMPDFEPLRRMLIDGVATTSELSKVVDIDEGDVAAASGAALFDLSGDANEYMVLLRCEYDRTIRWAGKPDKVETRTQDGHLRLSPRGSFALWQEERRGQSRPFDACDKDALRILRRALFALNSLEHERSAREAQRLAEAEEGRLRHALLEASRASSMGELASAIAHELNQPLSAISNFVSACRKELENAGVEIPAQAARLIDEAVAETTRAGDLLHRVRNFISAGDLNAEETDINQVIQQGITLAQHANELPDLQVSLLLDHETPKVMADPVQIGQVVLNLARNSIAAMRDSRRRKLTVQVVQKDRAVQVYFRDTGCGILPEQRRYLFEPFNRSTTSGMGIGLSLCRTIIEAHGGSIWSEPASHGAVFAFRLPIAGEPGD